MPKKISISKIKDALIKKLGGYTEQEMIEDRRFHFRETKIATTHLQLAQINGRMKFTELELKYIPEDQRERWIKDQLLHRICQQIGPYIEYQVGATEPPPYEVRTVRARLRVVQPENGAVLQEIPFPL